MSQWTIGRLFVVSLMFASSISSAQPQEISVEERYESLIRSIDSAAGRLHDDRAEAVGRAYDELFPIRSFQRIGQLDDKELDLVFQAAVNAARLAEKIAYLRQAELVFDELKSRQLASVKQAYYMQGLYVQMRMLSEARRFNRQHQAMDLEPIPGVRQERRLQPRQPTELVVSPDRQELFHRSVDMAGPVQIVVVAHPRCHFSRNAMLAIEADPVLSGAFRESAKWIVPPDFRLEMDAVRHWNEAHPATRLTLAYKVEEWPQLDYWGTPTFYFFREGKLEAKVTGWPKEGHREELVAALATVGLLPSGD